MLNCSRNPAPLQLRLIAAVLFALATAAGSAQTLARPGWVGSGLNVDPWWKQAIYYEIAAPPNVATPDFKAITARLDALHALGVDALLLPTPDLTLQRGATGPTAQTMAMMDSLDELIHQASSRRMRVLLDFTPGPTTDIAATARFWLTRGIAGFRLIPPPGSPQATQAILQSLRRATAAAVGQRILISDLVLNDDADGVPAPEASSRTRRSSRSRSRTSAAEPPAAADSAQLHIDTRLSQIELPEAVNIRGRLLQTLPEVNVLLDINPPQVAPGSPDLYPALAKSIAALQLTTHGGALIDSQITGQIDAEIDAQFRADAAAHLAAEPVPPPPPAPPSEAYVPYNSKAAAAARRAALPHAPVPEAAVVPPHSLAGWYRQLAALHHANAALRYGSISLLDFDEQNALVWLARPAANALALPVIVACNLSAIPVQISLAAQLRSLDLHGTYLRTLLRSDAAIGPEDLNSVTLPPFGVYIGELKR
jgi:hypothetical protein